MATRYGYTLGDFTRFARARFPTELASVADLDQYTFRLKNYYNDSNVVQRANMLLVGHYHYKADGPSVWARSDGQDVHYYYGREALLKVIKNEHKSKVYYSQPISFLSGTQDVEGMTLGRRLGQEWVEVCIHFLFLKVGDIPVVRNRSFTDMLRTFEFACVNREPNRQAEQDAMRIKLEQQNDDSQDEDYPTARFIDRRLVSQPKRRRVKQEVSSDEDMPPRPRPIDVHGRHSLFPPRNQHQRSSLVEQLQSHEDQIRAELSEEKTALQKTIQTLETEVVSQKARATIAEGRLRAEHKKIQVAEAYGEEWKGKHEIQEEATAEWKKTAIENEKSSKDWEAKYQGLRKKLRGLM